MNVKQYISSGIIEDYVLGTLSEKEMQSVENNASLYSEIRDEIIAYEKAIEQYARVFSVAIPADYKMKVLNELNNLQYETEADPNNLPFLNKYSEKNNWLKIVKPVLPERLEDDMLIKEIKNDGETFVNIIWSKVDYPDEVHDMVKECFLILEGECECKVGAETIKLGPGDFFEIPMHTHHDVKVLNGPVMAIVQRVKVA